VHGFVVLTLAKDFPACCIGGVSVEYLKLASAGWSNLNRTPVYPAFLWLVRRIFGPSLEPVLWIQVFFLSLGPAFVALFASLAFPAFPKVAYISGLLSSVSFTGIKVGHMILTEALFAPLSIGALVALYFGARQCKETFIVLSAVLGGLAFLVKPIFLFWWFFIPIFVFFFAGKHKPALKVVLLAMALGLAFPLGWSLVNFIKYRIFIPSWSGVATICIYWGARTLAGNDNEWRYISVRRFFIFVEESVKRATEQFVFEPNDANTWVKVRGMIESYLYSLWERGALAGPTPEAAYYVHVGLGKTMTAQDVLEGRLIVEIGIAAVRPAEFIVLRFMHKLQQA